MVFNKIIIMITSLLVSSSLWATFYLEPYIGYMSGEIIYKQTKDSSANIEETWKNRGYNFGGRLGLSGHDVFTGLTYDVTKIRSELGNDQRDDGRDDFTRSDVGFFLGYKVFQKIRLWGSYYFSSRWKDKNNRSGYWNKNMDTNLKGEGYQLGLGISLFSLLNLNIELKTHIIKTVELNHKSFSLPVDSENTLIDDIDLREICIGISAPMEF